MNRYLTEEAFHGLQQRIKRGEVVLSVPPGVAKQFFTRVTSSAIKGTTGVAVIAEKLLIWSGVVLAPLVLLACFGYVAVEFDSLAAFAIPMIGVFWTVFAGYTNERGKWQPLTIILSIAAVNTLILEFAYSIPIFLFTLSLWIHRLTYVASQTFLTSIVTNSYPAYDQLAEHVQITAVDAPCLATTNPDSASQEFGPENVD